MLKVGAGERLAAKLDRSVVLQRPTQKFVLGERVVVAS